MITGGLLRGRIVMRIHAGGTETRRDEKSFRAFVPQWLRYRFNENRPLLSHPPAGVLRAHDGGLDPWRVYAEARARHSGDGQPRRAVPDDGSVRGLRAGAE